LQASPTNFYREKRQAMNIAFGAGAVGLKSAEN
jgi:hypothetical protein